MNDTAALMGGPQDGAVRAIKDPYPIVFTPEDGPGAVYKIRLTAEGQPVRNARGEVLFGYVYPKAGR